MNLIKEETRMSLQDNIFDVEHIFHPTDDDGEPIVVAVTDGQVHIPRGCYEVGQKAWDEFYQWSCIIEERMDILATENKTLKDAIKIIQGVKT
jgi:hypothetical protein